MGSEILEQLVVVPDLMATLARQVDVAEKWSGAIASLMADDECRHGRLPTDPTPACGCWPQETTTAPTAAPAERTQQLLHCANGDHHWTRTPQRGRPPRSCPAHPRS